WVPLAYLTLLLLLLFGLLVLPGLLNHGALLTIESLPPAAAVEIDGVYVGATPVEAFVDSGERRIVLSRPGYAEQRVLVEVPGRLFGSLLVPKRQTVTQNLPVGEPDMVLSAAFEDFTAWSYIGDANARYQFPPILSEAIAGLAFVDEAPSSNDVLLRGSLDATSDVLAKDLLSGAFRADAGPGVLSGSSLADTATALAGLTAANPAIHYLAGEIASDGVLERITQTDWYADRTAEATTSILPYTREGDVEYAGGGRQIQAAGMTYYEVPGTVFVMGATRSDPANAGLLQPHTVRITPFFVGQTEVTRGDYLAFLEANPQWGLGALDTLVQSGLVSTDYLADWIDDRPTLDDSLPVVNVSAYAAEAYAEWVTEQLADSLPGYRARLPYEAEWEWAAEFAAAANYPGIFLQDGRDGPAPVGSLPGGPIPLYDLAGNVWEWNANSFHRASYLVEPPQHAPAPRVEAAPRFAHRSVRGGSWANLPGTVSPTSRGSQPVWWCTPYLGFRLVLVQQ
ncbi:MAG: SUMF1/EgtB/PvdO family nonheme iron enzyme, partial [Spirochaetota bacterium]